MNRRFDYYFHQQLQNLKREMQLRPLNLGGTSNYSGGSGGPPGGFIGSLPQTRVSYDYTEAESLDIPSSGASLVDNLNRIRYRVAQLETASGVGALDAYRMVVTDSTGVIVTNPNLEYVVNVYSNDYPSVTIGQKHDFHNWGDGYCLNLVSDEVCAPYLMGLWAYDWEPSIDFYRQNDSVASPTKVMYTDVLGEINFNGVDQNGGNPRESATIMVLALQDFSNTAHGTMFSVQLVPLDSTTKTDAFILTTDYGKFNNDVIISNTGSYYLGDRNTDGSCRVTISGGNPQLEKRQSGVWSAVSNEPTPLRQQAIYTIEGTVSVSTGKLRICNHLNRDVTILEVHLDIATPPANQHLIVDINDYDGVTIFTNQAHRPEIYTDGHHGATYTIDNDIWYYGDFLTVDVDQVGTGTPGSDLTITIVYQ